MPEQRAAACPVKILKSIIVNERERKVWVVPGARNRKETLLCHISSFRKDIFSHSYSRRSFFFVLFRRCCCDSLLVSRETHRAQWGGMRNECGPLEESARVVYWVEGDYTQSLWRNGPNTEKKKKTWRKSLSDLFGAELCSVEKKQTESLVRWNHYGNRA